LVNHSLSFGMRRESTIREHKPEHASIIMATFRKGANNRDLMFRKSVKSLIDNTKYPYELKLMDNTWINLGMALARNKGFHDSSGGYVVFVDDDIEFLPPTARGCWLTQSIQILKDYSGKYISTPVHTVCRGHRKHELPKVGPYRQNRRVGSNCLVMRRRTFEKLGDFKNLATGPAGAEFCDRQVYNGYTVLVTADKMVEDLGWGVHSYA